MSPKVAPKDSPGTTRLGRIAVWLGPLLVLAVAAQAVNAFPVGILNDGAVYVELAKALATGAGLHYIAIPGNPAATHFPPGYPALLAVLWRIVPAFPANILLFKAVNAVLVAVVAAWMARFARRRFGVADAPSALAAAVLCVGVPTLVLSALVMSETLFLVLLLPALLLAERVVDEHECNLLTVLMAGALIGVVTLVRSQGLALAGAFVFVLLLRRRYRNAAVGMAATFAVIAPWLYWQHAHAGDLPLPLRGTYGPYGSWFVNAVHAGGISLIGQSMAHTAHESATALSTWVAPLGTPGAGALALILLLPVVVVGAVSMGRAAPVTATFLAGYLGMVLLWPYAPVRFLYAIWPLLVAVPLIGARALWRADWASRAPMRVSRRLRVALLIVAAVPAVGYARVTVRGYRGHWWESLPRQRGPVLRAAIRAVQIATSPDAVVSTMDDAATYLYTGRRAVPIASFNGTDYLHPPTVAQTALQLGDIIAAYHPDAIVVTSEGQRAAAEILASRRPPVVALADSAPGAFLYAPTSK